MTTEEDELMQFVENAKENGCNVLCLSETTRDDKNLVVLQNVCCIYAAFMLHFFAKYRLLQIHSAYHLF